MTYGLEQQSDLTVYHCVDLLGEVAGIDKALIHMSERNLAKIGVQVIGSSRLVVDHLTDIGFDDVKYWPNVADTTTISHQRPPTSGRLARAFFAGRLTAEKIDYEIVRAVGEAGVPVALAGPISSEADQRSVERLVSAGAEYLGHLDFKQLAREYWKSTVGLIPYPVNAYTAGVSPLKLYEYLAAGLSVVATPLPELRHVDVLGVTICQDTAEFADAVVAAVSGFSDSDAEARIEVARQHSWDARGEAARALVQPILGQ